MKKLTTRDLFVSHIIRTMALRHIYIKLRLTEYGTVISFGSDLPVDDVFLSDSIGSRLVFNGEDYELWPEAVDLADVKNSITESHPETVVLTLAEDEQELMIEVKVEVPVPENPVTAEAIAHSGAEIIDYVYTHKRTILAVDKDDNFGFLMIGVCGLYTLNDFCEIVDIGDVNIEHILALDRSTFDVYYLYEDYDQIVFEITNKLL